MYKIPSMAKKCALYFGVTYFQNLKMTGFLQQNLCLVIMPLSICLGMSNDIMLELVEAADYLIMWDRLPTHGDSVWFISRCLLIPCDWVKWVSIRLLQAYFWWDSFCNVKMYEVSQKIMQLCDYCIVLSVFCCCLRMKKRNVTSRGLKNCQAF